VAFFLVSKENIMIILSLFDGISCGRIALERAKIPVDKYFASEVKKSAIKLTKYHYPDTVHIGDVTKIRYENGVLYTEMGEFETHIDMVIGGSPCQDFSVLKLINHDRLGLKGEKSKLFYEYLRILKEIEPKYFLLENVRMVEESEKALNQYLGVKGIHINSSLVSFQNRPRIYWTNIPRVTLPKDRYISFRVYQSSDYEYCKKYKLNRTPYREKMWNNGKGRNKIRLGCQNITYADKINCLTRKQDRCPNSGLIEFEDFCRYLTREEMEKAQTLPAGYTLPLSKRQAEDVCGDCWTVDVVAHIFQNLGQEPIVVNRYLKTEEGQMSIFDVYEE
jgi:site-specific DNA-cytosine methylase